MSLKQLLKKAYTLDYEENSFSNKQHEKSVRTIIEESGFEEAEYTKKSDKTKVIKNLSNGCYVYQPKGSQNFPDFIIRYKGKVYNIECKSSQKTKKPMWNCSYPEKDSIYIFSIPSSNILFFGEWICDEESKEIMKDFIEDSKAVAKKYSSRLLNLDSDYKWKVTFRKMFEQSTVFDRNRQVQLKKKMNKFIDSLEKVEIVFEDD